MPLIRPGMPKPPPGFDVVLAKLEEYDQQMKTATQEESRGVVGVTTRPRHSSRGDNGARKRSRDGEDKSNEDTTAAPEGITSTITATEEDIGASTPGEELTIRENAPIPPLWSMAAINRARTRYVFLAYHKQRSISKEVFDYCVEMRLIDGGLARRWRLPGYEKLCCTACGVPGAASLAANVTSKFALRDRQERRLSTSASQRRIDDTATCICRVPSTQRKNKSFVACAVCGCRGCCSTDAVKPTAKESCGESAGKTREEQPTIASSQGDS